MKFIKLFKLFEEGETSQDTSTFDMAGFQAELDSIVASDASMEDKIKTMKTLKSSYPGLTYNKQAVFALSRAAKTIGLYDLSPEESIAMYKKVNPEKVAREELEQKIEILDRYKMGKISAEECLSELAAL